MCGCVYVWMCGFFNMLFFIIRVLTFIYYVLYCLSCVFILFPLRTRNVSFLVLSLLPPRENSVVLNNSNNCSEQSGTISGNNVQ
jgi:hypothetical protein